MGQRERLEIGLGLGGNSRWTCLPLAACLAMVACSEPVDCGKEPARCLPPAYGVAHSSVARPQPTLPPTGSTETAHPSARPSRPSPTAAVKSAADRGMQRARVLAPSDTMAARTRDGAEAPIQNDAAAAAVAPELKLLGIRKALAQAAPALKNHDFAALKAVASQRFAGNIGEIETKFAERFWRHADKYVPVLSGPPPAIALQDQEGGKVQATLTAADGSELRCILVQEGGTWKIDRF